MQINIKTSADNGEVVRQLTAKLPAGTKENVIARIALGYSLQRGRKFSQSEFNSYDSQGKEYKDNILFPAQYREFYIALICQHYGIYKTDENIPRYVKLHIDDGLEQIGNLFKDNNNYTFMDFLTDNLEKGISYLNNVESDFSMVKNNNQNINKTLFENAIKLSIGRDTEGNEIFFNFNDTSRHNNSHIAVAGASGTGKTQFALHLLREISEKTNNQVNFIYLDFKGLKDDDVSKLDDFFQRTKTRFVDPMKSPFPVNPISFIDSINANNKTAGIDKLTDIIAKYNSSIGTKQKGKLRDAITEAFKDKKPGEYPDFKEIEAKLIDIYEGKTDSLTEIIGSLCRYNVFKENKKAPNFLNENLYFSLSGDLPNDLRFTSLFLIITYIYNVFMNMENTPVNDHICAMRYVILIDEAHVIFKEKKYHDILEKILREIRSKGVSVILLSQGIDEFNQKDFDFSTNCETAFLLNINDKSNSKSISKFLGLSDSEVSKACRSLEDIEKGQAISNLKEFEKCKLFEVKQYWKD